MVPFLLLWMAIGLCAGAYLLRRAAPYGRFSDTHWGPMVSNKWGWVLMESTVLVAFAIRIPWARFDIKSPAGVMIAMFLFHYIHRALVYPFMIRTRGKRMPVVIMASAMVFNSVNGTLLGLWFAKAQYPANWFSSPWFTFGTTLFVLGMAINWWSDYTLIHLRKKGETGYKIPRQGLFRYTSSPNLFGEITEWGGYALLTCSLPALAFFVWTCANLIPRALSIRRWYRQALATALLVAICGFAHAQNGDTILHNWETREKDGKIEVLKNGTTYYAIMRYGKELFEADGKTYKKDVNNPDPSLRTRDLKDYVLISGLTFQDGKWTGGKIYNFKDGNSYDVTIEIEGRVMSMRVYKGIPLLGKTLKWDMLD